MADGKLVFPVKFDLQRAVQEASGDVDKVLRQMQTAVNSKPLIIKTDISELKAFEDRLKNLNIGREYSGKGKNIFLAQEGSLASINAQMDKLIDQWNKLAESERIESRESGKFTKDAKDIINRYAELTGASRTYAKSLQTLQSEADKVSQSMEKRIAKSREISAMLQAEKTSISNVTAQLKFYTQLRDKHNSDPKKGSTSEYQYACDKVKELSGLLSELKAKAKSLSLKDALHLPEWNLQMVKDKISALNLQKDNATRNGSSYAQITNEIARLRQVKADMMAQDKEATKTEAELRAEREAGARAVKKAYDDANTAYQRMIAQQRANYGSKKEAGLALQSTLFGNPKTFDEYNAKITALQTKLNTLDPNSARFFKFNAELEKTKRELTEATNAVAQMSRTIGSLNDLNAQLTVHLTRMNELSSKTSAWEKEALAAKNLQAEIERVNQRMALYQNKAFAGLSDSITQKQVDQLKPIQAEIEALTRRYNVLNAAKMAFDAKGNLTPQAQTVLQKLNAEYEKQGNILRNVDSAMDAYKKKLADEEAELNRMAAAEQKRNKHLQESIARMNANEQRIDGLNQKLQRYQELAQRLTVGSDAWNKTAIEIKRITEELQRANQQLMDFQQKSLQGLSDSLVNGKVQALNQYRAELQAIDEKFNRLHQTGAAYNTDGTLTRQANAYLDQRIAKEKQISEMTRTAAEAQLQREKQINDELAKQQQRRTEIQKRWEASRQAAQNEQRILSQNNDTIAQMNAKLAILQQRLQNQKVGGFNFAQTAEEIRVITKELEKAQKKVDDLTGKTNKQAEAQKKVTKEYSHQTTYLNRLVQRMMMYASVQQLGSFLTKVREVTAQFELQRVSLGAIINDQARANELFSEIKQFALKSPVKIMDLTKYTKQLAAYRIETDKLFDTTKRLADVAVGLGGNGIMERLILAYGETKASHVMNAKELRQFAMMGIPMLELLSEKLTELKGRTVSTAEAFEMIKKRMVGFDVVEQVFEDMTNAGGTFYNMQERQGNTLYGMWAKLGDAASVMYDQIGNTESVNGAMRNVILLMSELMRNWKAVGKTLGYIVLPAAVITMFTKWAFSSQRVMIAELKVKNAVEARRIAEERLDAALKRGVATEIQKANAALKTAQADERAARASATRGGLMSGGIQSFAQAGLWGLAIAAVTAIAYKLFEAYENATRLKNEINKIRAEGEVIAEQSERTFIKLADKAATSHNLKEQQDALEELKRRFKDCIPVEDLTIENLQRLREGSSSSAEAYKDLTAAIKEYYYEQQRRAEENAIAEEYGKTMVEVRARAKDVFKEFNISTDEQAEFWIEFNEQAKDTSKTLEEQISTSLKNAGIKGGEDLTKALMNKYSGLIEGVDDTAAFLTKNGYFSGSGIIGGLVQQLSWLGKRTGVITSSIDDYGDAIRSQAEDLEMCTSYWDRMTGKAGKYVKLLEDAKANMDKFQPVDDEGKAITKDTNYYGWETAMNEEQIRQWGDAIRKALQQEKVAIKNEWFGIADNETFGVSKIVKLDLDAIKEALGSEHPQIKNLIRVIAKEYNNLVPSDATVLMMRDKVKQLTGQLGMSMNDTRQYFMETSEDISAYAKRISETLEDAKTKLNELKLQQEEASKGSWFKQWTSGSLDKIKEEQDLTQNQIDLLTALMALLGQFAPNKGSKGSKQDPRLQNLKEEISLVQKLYQEYKQLEKQEGAAKAAEDMNKMAEQSIAALSKKYGIELPKDAKSLQSALEILYKKMEALPKKAFPALEKELRELKWTIEKVDIDDSQAKIEKSLKELADRISRTKTAKEFYEKILSQTGDDQLAVNLALRIYGEDGTDLNKSLQEEIQTLLGKGTGENYLDFSAAIRDDGSIDYDQLIEISKGYLELGQISDETYNKLLKMRDDDRKDLAKTVEGWLKATEKAKTYSDKLLDLRRKTQTEIDKINKQETDKEISPELAEQLRKGFERKEAEEVAKLQYEAFKDSPMYVQLFGDLEHASTTMLENMKQRLQGLQGEWKNLDPKQLKELQSRLKEIDAQLTTRNPFATLTKSLKKYWEMRRKGDKNGNKSSKEADKALIKATKEREIAEAEYLKILRDEKATEEDIAKAKDKFDRAQENEAGAQAATEAWSGVKLGITSATDAILGGLNAVGDIAHSIANVMEAVGADEEDVAYWNTIGDSMGEITSGIQDIVQSMMSGDLMGTITSVLTALPKMFVGFVNLFSAGKIRKANKEIKKQQEIIEGLEYAYSRLEAAMERCFGVDYINNYNQRLANLQASAEAYQKQLDAERSKGKKADKDKIKEYEEAVRDAYDKIAELQSELTEKMTGTEVESAARDFATAWLEARAEFENTADAISEKYKELVKSMVLEGAAARLIQGILQPMYDTMDEMLKDGNINGAIDYLAGSMDQFIGQTDNAMETLWQALQARGIDIKNLISSTDKESKGISREFATASEESILGLTRMYDTNNWYVSQILEEVRGIRASGIDMGNVVDTSKLQTEAMSHLSMIAQHTAETVEECRRSATAAESCLAEIKRVIKPKNTTPTHAVAVKIC